jgi:UDP-N-acetylglucosamine:LPS N-acetylglucosamine transferase
VAHLNRAVPAALESQLRALLPRRSELLEMARAARAQARTDAAERVAEMCLAEGRA